MYIVLFYINAVLLTKNFFTHNENHKINVCVKVRVTSENSIPTMLKHRGGGKKKTMRRGEEARSFSTAPVRKSKSSQK